MTPINNSKPASNVPYVIAVLFMAMLGVVAVLVLTALRPAADNTILIAAVIGFLTPSTLALFALMKAQETHLSVNSQLSAYLQEARDLARMQGKEEGSKQAHADMKTESHADVTVVQAGKPTILKSSGEPEG
jgi:hypothetical protein